MRFFIFLVRKKRKNDKKKIELALLRLQSKSECSATFYTTLARTLKDMVQIYQMMVILIFFSCIR